MTWREVNGIFDISIYTLTALGDSNNLIGSLSLTMTLFGGEYKAKQNRSRKLGVLRKLQSKDFSKIQEYPSVHDSEGKKRLHGV